VSLDLVIRSGRVTDGQGGPLAPADVGVRGDTVVAIEPELDPGEARVLDADGAVVAPGFIDIHAHGDVVPLMCPEAPGRLHDGVTLEIVGNCGESPFPQTEAMLAERRDSEDRYGVAVDWQTLDGFARRQDAAGSGINRGSLVGHSNVRIAVLGEADRPPTEAELAAMRHHVAQAMDAGAFGMSTGLIYTPGMYAPPWEIWALAEEVARRGGFYASHIRNESDAVVESIEEFAEVGRRSGVRLQLSHVKVSGRANWPRVGAVVALLERLRSEGLDLACDRYPYVAGCTGLTALLPGYAREGGREQLLQRLADPSDRERLHQAMAAKRPLDADWEAVRISSAHSEAHADAEGRSIGDLAQETGRDAADVVFELLAASRGRTSILVFSMREENLETFLRLPYVAVASDSTARAAEGPTAYGRPHPRTYGTASRFLGRYVRDRGLVSLPEGVRRLTGLPASRLGLTRRGVLRPGAIADITIFDPEAIIDRATFDEPKQYSVGVRHVVVNGAVALEDGELTGTRAGRFLRRTPR
jgi:N-acyl-D-amino-acid deacylase